MPTSPSSVLATVGALLDALDELEREELTAGERLYRKIVAEARYERVAGHE
jgi:hypothetical protein